MSTYQWIRCLDDGETSGSGNHEADMMSSAIRSQVQIVALFESPLGEHIDDIRPLGYFDGINPVSFVYQHAGHRMIIEDEYGYFYNPMTGEREAGGDE